MQGNQQLSAAVDDLDGVRQREECVTFENASVLIERPIIVAIQAVHSAWWERGRSCAPERAASAVAAYGLASVDSTVDIEDAPSGAPWMEHRNV